MNDLVRTDAPHVFKRNTPFSAELSSRLYPEGPSGRLSLMLNNLLDDRSG